MSYCTAYGVTFCKGNHNRCTTCPDIPLPLAVRLRDDAGPALPQMVANRRAQLAQHRGCNVTTCPSAACQGRGECQKTPVVASPPLAPDLKYVYPFDDKPRTIIAFTGLAGAGKSTAAMHLVNHRGWHRLRFAGPLKAMMAALGLTAAEIDGDRKEQPCDLLGGKTPRWAMQTIGTQWGRNLIGDDLWIRAWQHALAQVPAGVPVVVDDCRFPNEAAAITAAGGIIVRIDRPGAGTASVHESEQHALPAATTLHNTLSEQNLREQVDVLLRDLSWADTTA